MFFSKWSPIKLFCHTSVLARFTHFWVQKNFCVRDKYEPWRELCWPQTITFFILFETLKKLMERNRERYQHVFFVRVWCIDGSSVAAADNFFFVIFHFFVCLFVSLVWALAEWCLFVSLSISFPLVCFGQRWLTMLCSAQMTGTNKKCMSAVLEVIRKDCEA